MGEVQPRWRLQVAVAWDYDKWCRAARAEKRELAHGPRPDNRWAAVGGKRKGLAKKRQPSSTAAFNRGQANWILYDCVLS